MLFPEPYPTKAEIAAARSWIADCGFAELDQEMVDELPDCDIVRGVEFHYDGGWEQFRIDNVPDCSEVEAMVEMLSAPPVGLRELDAREVSGIRTGLFWDPATGHVLVRVQDAQHPAQTFRVKAAEAADAFHHPYAYLAAAC